VGSKPKAATTPDEQFTFIEISQAKRSFILTALPVRLLVAISYAAVRRKDEEEGAVQRVLNQGRITGIKSFALQGGDFPASIVLNWVGDSLRRNGMSVTVPELPHSAQLLDGQHRVAGLQEAIKESPDLGSQLVPVAIYEGLSTRDCADIFLSINTEQRPVPRSLVFDLYGIASNEVVDHAAVRARDITMSLNEEGQAYGGFIKFPNTPRQRGGVPLSTAVTAIKELVEEKGLLEQVGASSLELQKQIFQNYFNALSSKYGDLWGEKDNAFLYAAGFLGAIEFLKLKVIPYCNTHKSYTRATIASILAIEKSDLIKQEEIKGLGGKDAPRKIYERLVSMFGHEDVTTVGFEV
jgi:DNA sulfur modification protein DndB